MFRLKKSTFSQKTSNHESKMNAFARAQSRFQMLTLLQIYHRNQCSKTWNSKCLALIAIMVGAFGVSPKVEGTSPPLSKKLLREHPLKTNADARTQLTFPMLTNGNVTLSHSLSLYICTKSSAYSYSSVRLSAYIMLHLGWICNRPCLSDG